VTIGAPAPPLENWPLRVRVHRAEDRWSLRRWLLVVGAITLLLSVAAVLAGSLGLSRLAAARAVVVDEVQPALIASQDLSTALLDQETGVRGFILTGSEPFLDPYEAGIAEQERAASELRRLAALGHLNTLVDDLDRLERDIDMWRTGFATPTVAAVRSTGPTAPQPDVILGKAEFDAVRGALDRLDQGLVQAQTEAVARQRAAGDALRWVFVGISAGLAVLIVAVGVWLRRAVTTPLSGLASEVRLVVEGDAHRKVVGRGPLEVVQLAEDIDAMRRHILTELDALEQAHRRLDAQTTDLERSNRDLEQFAYVASHDLQEPLRKVSSFCQLLQRRYGGQLDERADSYIAFAVDGASRMQQLINDLLAFSRVGRLTSGFVVVDLKEAAEAALNQLSTVREETGAEITVGELPSVNGEPGLLVQLLANLVGNAMKFRRPGIPPVVTIDARPHEDGWEISVADNGIGVEPEYRDKVFVIFQRLHAREEYPGTGIGLAMAKKIVEYHGGRIWMDGDLADGATVRLTLPALAPQDRPGPTQDPSDRSDPSDPTPDLDRENHEEFAQ
jgi:signal transduction histidine kinase